MSNGLNRFGVSDDELMAAIRSSAEIDAAINQVMAKEIVPMLRSHPDTPVDSGKFAASIKVVKKARNGRGAVGSRHYTAAFIEFGTGEPGPTKVYAPFQKVAEHYGGTLDTGAELAAEQ